MKPLSVARRIFENHTELPYHITARCINRDWFSIDTDVVWEIMTRHLYFINHAFNLRIHAFVLMSNHFHLIVRTPDANLSEAMRYFMRETSREITFASGRINQTYGSRFHRSLLSSPLYYLHAYKYLYRNPIEAGLCELVEEYKFSSLQGLIGETWLDVPVTEDENWGNLLTRGKTLEWLNTPPSKEHWTQVQTALKKPSFKLPREKGKASSLENDTL